MNYSPMAVKSPAVEVLILLSVSLLVIALRFYLRTEAVGWRRLAAHDHLMILIVVSIIIWTTVEVCVANT